MYTFVSQCNMQREQHINMYQVRILYNVFQTEELSN